MHCLCKARIILLINQIFLQNTEIEFNSPTALNSEADEILLFPRFLLDQSKGFFIHLVYFECKITCDGLNCYTCACLLLCDRQRKPDHRKLVTSSEKVLIELLKCLQLRFVFIKQQLCSSYTKNRNKHVQNHNLLCMSRIFHFVFLQSVF